MCLIACLTAFGSSAIADAAPFVPQSGSEVLERLRERPFDPAASELRKLRSELARNPRDLALATRIARRYIEEARTRADPRFLGYAQAALAPWWTLAQPPSNVLVLRATIRQSNHDFDSALEDLSQALKVAPAHAQAWLMRASLLQLKGEYAAAAESCERLSRFAGEFVSGACLATVVSMTGEAESSYERLAQLLERAADASSAQKAWIQTALAEIATRLDRRAAAEAHFKRAMQYGPADPYLKAAYADFLLDSARAADVMRLLADDTRIDALVLRIALAEQALGRAELQRRVADLQARFDAARARGDRLHQREEARFLTQLLHKPLDGLRLAQANWAVQKEPADARVLLEAALEAGEISAARPVTDWMRKNRVEDATLWRLARRIEKAP